MSEALLEKKTDEVSTYPADQFNNGIRLIYNNLYKITNNYGVSINYTNNGLLGLALARKWSFGVGGSANSIVLTTSAPFAHLPIENHLLGQEISFIAIASNTGAVSIAIDGIVSKNLKNIDNSNLQGGEIVNGEEVRMYYNGTNYILLNSKRSETDIVNTRKFSVNSGKINATTGVPNFMITNGTNTVTIQAGGSNPNLVMTNYQGKIHIQSSDVVISGINSNGLYNVMRDDVSASYKVELQSKFTESHIPPDDLNGSNGDYYILTNTLITYKKISGTWVEYSFVILGEINRSGGVIATPVCYAFNGITYFEKTQPFEGTIDHNIGSMFYNTIEEMECISTSSGFTIGAKYLVLNHKIISNVSDYYSRPISKKQKNSCFFGVHNDLSVTNDAGDYTYISNTNTNFKLHVKIERSY